MLTAAFSLIKIAANGGILADIILYIILDLSCLFKRYRELIYCMLFNVQSRFFFLHISCAIFICRFFYFACNFTDLQSRGDSHIPSPFLSGVLTSFPIVSPRSFRRPCQYIICHNSTSSPKKENRFMNRPLYMNLTHVNDGKGDVVVKHLVLIYETSTNTYIYITPVVVINWTQIII